MPSERQMNQNLMGLGWQIASTLIVFTFGGYWLDRWLGTKPWLLLAGATVGMISIFVQIYRISVDLNQADKKRSRNRKSEGRG